MRLGPLQRTLLARRGSLGIIRAFNYRERRSIRGLSNRGILVPALGWPDCWRVNGE